MALLALAAGCASPSGSVPVEAPMPSPLDAVLPPPPVADELPSPPIADEPEEITETVDLDSRVHIPQHDTELDAGATAPQRERSYPYPGKNRYAERRFRVEVGQGFLNASGDPVIELVLINDEEEVVSRKYFRAGDTDSRWVDGEGEHFIASGTVKVLDIYRKLGPGGREEFQVKIVG